MIEKREEKQKGWGRENVKEGEEETKAKTRGTGFLGWTKLVFQSCKI